MVSEHDLIVDITEQQNYFTQKIAERGTWVTYLWKLVTSGTRCDQWFAC